jgi:hypothetical protein
MIGPHDADGIVLRVLGRTHPDAGDFWDGNWLRTTLDLAVGPFSGSVAANLRAEELAAFRKDLQRLYEAVEGHVVLSTMERWVELAIDGDGLGHVHVVGEVFDTAGAVGDSVRFHLDIDPTYLPRIIDSLMIIEATWPAVGAT